jgi:uncharacterized protein (DUF433 family)
MMVENGDELIGVPRVTAARVIGVTERRLRSWNQMGLVVPSISEIVRGRRYWTYSLEDLVQGRVIEGLEARGVDIRPIRRIVEAVRTSTHPEPLSSLSWATDAGEVFVGYPDGSWIGGRRPNQTVAVEVLELDSIRVDARRAARARPPESAGRVERRRGALGSQPVFAGTRIPVTSVLAYLRRGLDDERILAAYPDLEPADIDLARRELAATG